MQMSFTGSIMIQKGFLDKDSFEKYIIDYFKPDRAIAKSRTENTWYRNFCLYNIGLCLDENVEDDHYANRESFITGQNFHFSQEIVIDFEKEALSKDQYILCIGFLRYLKEKTDSDMLFVSDTDDEICLFHGNHIIFSEGSKYLEDLI